MQVFKITWQLTTSRRCKRSRVIEKSIHHPLSNSSIHDNHIIMTQSSSIFKGCNLLRLFSDLWITHELHPRSCKPEMVVSRVLETSNRSRICVGCTMRFLTTDFSIRCCKMHQNANSLRPERLWNQYSAAERFPWPWQQTVKRRSFFAEKAWQTMAGAKKAPKLSTAPERFEDTGCSERLSSQAVFSSSQIQFRHTTQG